VVSDNEYETGVPDDVSVPEDLLDWDDAKILDISGGGAKLIQRNNLEKNEVVKLKFVVSVLDESLFFNLFARILGSANFKGRSDLYEQRLEFMKISQENRDKIIRFIFENERMARAKETGLK
jgi:c-di-GMP-binding flagellar brake protein YcgR